MKDLSELIKRGLFMAGSVAFMACYPNASSGIARLQDYVANDDNFAPPEIVQQVYQEDVLGNEKPETFVIVDGVKYYSHVDCSNAVKK